jgi:hypothetical protein
MDSPVPIIAFLYARLFGFRGGGAERERRNGSE